jgi:hypothetical protein
MVVGAMSKLDGNERWKSKMMITQHVEQHENRHEAKFSGVATKEELTMIRDKVMLPHVMTMLQKGIDSIATSTFTLKDLSIRSLELLLYMAGEDDRELRKELTRRNIKIHLEESGDDIFLLPVLLPWLRRQSRDNSQSNEGRD